MKMMRSQQRRRLAPRKENAAPNTISNRNRRRLSPRIIIGLLVAWSCAFAYIFSNEKQLIITRIPEAQLTETTTTFLSSNAHHLSIAKTAATDILTSNGVHQCVCPLPSSLDCLSSIKCLPSTLQAQQTLIAHGIMSRIAIKSISHFRAPINTGTLPLGKTTQYGVIRDWKSWISTTSLSQNYNAAPTGFINDALYPFCVKHKLKARNCFFTAFDEMENLGELESIAFDIHKNDDIKQAMIEEDVRKYLRMKANHTTSPLADLLTFAYMTRIHFNLQPSIRGVYKQKLRSIQHQTQETHPFTVAMHLRRADSCYHRQTGYETKASSIHDESQNTALRKCYNTSVYLEALKRVQQISGHRVLDVYIATDFAGSVLQEIETKYNALFRQMNWYFLNYSRDTFVYGNMIEGAGEKKAMLGESAIADLWLLSHGQVFIGHLGSRYGKIAWLLATARYNHFVPYFSVDGHSFCCEIDEHCGKMSEYIPDMDNCLTFAHEMSGYKMNDDYWTVNGSTLRQRYFEDHYQ